MGLTRKKTTYINITPIPSYIPRQLAIDILHSHGEIIELNPLVLGFDAIKAPRDAPADEFYATWYEIRQRIQYIPGIGKLGSGEIKFKGCFHDMPWGLQTHTYAPAGVDMRNKWQICGSQPGEPPETRELGIGAPAEGLYLREDIEIKCNVTMVSFVKKEMKAASKVLVDRMLKKAELIDAGALSAMMENGRLKTINPADRSTSYNNETSQLPGKQPYNLPKSPMRSPALQPQQMHLPRKESQGSDIIMELPGDFYHPQPSPSHQKSQDTYYSNTSELSGNSPDPSDGRWSYQSASTRPSSYASSGGMRSPAIDYNNKEYSSELPTMEETHEEHEERRRFQEVPWPGKEEHDYKYNPQDFARMQQQYAQPPQYSPYDHIRRPSGA